MPNAGIAANDDAVQRHELPATILGVYDGHNSGAALVHNGTILAAVEEERYSRVKNHDGRLAHLSAPNDSVRECLRHTTGLVDTVAIALEEPRALQRSVEDSYINALQTGRLIKSDRDPSGILEHPYAFQRQRITKIKAALNEVGLPATSLHFEYVNHHLAHAASVYFTSGTDNALVVTLDGKGDNLSGTVYRGSAGELLRLAEINHLDSLGHFYSAITVCCGFSALRHEGKVTGLAAYGCVNKSLLLAFRNLFSTDDGAIVGHLNDGLPLGDYPNNIYSGCPDHVARIASVVSGHSLPDVAATAQYFLETIVVDFVRYHCRAHATRHLQVSGGVFGNVRLNQQIAALPDLSSFQVHPAMSDAGLAMGAALYIHHRDRRVAPGKLGNVFLGPESSREECERVLQDAGLNYETPSDIEASVAQLLASGRVVCRHVGRLEYGPRALGNRSILYRANDPTAKDWLNKKLDRTDTMPFAPVTLDEQMGSCYELIPAARGSDEFMTITYTCTEFMRQSSPGVVHLDGSARPQRVCSETNPTMHKLLKYYYELTGLASLINTSFNLHEEPIVCSASDAVSTFIRGHFEFMQLGPFLVRHR